MHRMRSFRMKNITNRMAFLNKQIWAKKKQEEKNMPHVEIKCYPGRSEEVKKKCAEKVAAEVAELLGCNISAVSVAIKEVEKENWKEQVYDGQIFADEKALYVKPGYTC